ncbi:MAG TPA: MaoC family dehydratase [Anaeromyxobacter sp.]
MSDEGTLHWEDFPVGRVRELGPTPPVTRQAIVEFGRQFDPQPFHVEDAAARESSFGGLVASGWHTCGMAMRLYVDAVLRRAASLGSPGIDKLRWLKPVRPGDVLRLRVEVVEARPSESKPHLGLVRSRWQMTNQASETVLEMEGWGMFRRRGA